MKKQIFLVLIALLVLSFSVFAQFDDDARFSSSRLTNLANQLKRNTVDLSDRASDIFRNSTTNSRSDIEAAFLAQQLDASAGLFQDMVRNNRRASELRDAAALLSDLARRAPSYGSNSYYWRDAKRSIEDINRELGLGGGGSGGGNGGGWGNQEKVIGKARWKGTVDNEVHLRLRNNTIDVSIFAGQNYGIGSYTFTSPLPNSRVNVYVNKKKGRGGAAVIQQPDKFNDYTAVIKILDDDGGAKEYDVEIYWTK